MISKALSETQLQSEIRELLDEHEEGLVCDGINTEFELKKRPYKVIVKLVKNQEDSESSDLLISVKELKERIDYSLDYKNHKIIFKETFSEGQKIQIVWMNRLETISDQRFLTIFGNEDLRDSAAKHYGINPEKQDGFRNEFKWHSITRLASNIEEYRYMYEKFLSLLLKHRRHHKDYFQLKTESGTFFEPNFLSRTNRLIFLAEEFFEIYSSIINKTNFDYPKKEYSGQILRGTVNWQKTIINSSSIKPTKFFASIPYRKFDTPENILLVFCLYLIYRESKKILQTKLNELNENNLKNSLTNICDKSENLIKKFPFPKIIGLSKKFWNMEVSNKQITLLINQMSIRLRKGLIKNKAYGKMLGWIGEFDQLDLSFADQENTTNYPLSSMKSLDTIYEAWIFFTIYDYLKIKNYHPFLKLDSHKKGESFNAYFDFQINGKLVKFFYEKGYNKIEKDVWIGPQTPDFTVECDDQLVCIFDAKNYLSLRRLNEAKMKMMGYMMNGGCTFGSLIFPYYPKLDLTKKNEKKKVRKHYIKKFPFLEDPKKQKELDSKIKDFITNPDSDFELIGSSCFKNYPVPENPVFKDYTYMDIKLEPKEESKLENEFVIDKLLKIIMEQI
jgi:hypothetical protein